MMNTAGDKASRIINSLQTMSSPDAMSFDIQIPSLSAEAEQLMRKKKRLVAKSLITLNIHIIFTS
jgi:hypothetical protein